MEVSEYEDCLGGARQIGSHFDIDALNVEQLVEDRKLMLQLVVVFELSKLSYFFGRLHLHVFCQVQPRATPK